MNRSERGVSGASDDSIATYNRVIDLGVVERYRYRRVSSPEMA